MENKTMGNGSWSTSIDKLMLWRGGNWTRHETKATNLTLRVYYDQLMITTTTSILETLNMHCKIKGIYKQDILILVFTMCQEIRKLKFQIKTDVTGCLKKLGEHFPVVNYNNALSNAFSSNYRNINDVLKIAMEKEDSATSVQISPIHKDFVKMSLLDPSFPQIVIETEKILAGVLGEIIKK